MDLNLKIKQIIIVETKVEEGCNVNSIFNIVKSFGNCEKEAFEKIYIQGDRAQYDKLMNEL